MKVTRLRWPWNLDIGSAMETWLLLEGRPLENELLRPHGRRHWLVNSTFRVLVPPRALNSLQRIDLLNAESQLVGGITCIIPRTSFFGFFRVLKFLRFSGFWGFRIFVLFGLLCFVVFLLGGLGVFVCLVLLVFGGFRFFCFLGGGLRFLRF